MGGPSTCSASLKWKPASRVAKVPVIFIFASDWPTHDLAPSEKGYHRFGLFERSLGSTTGADLPTSTHDSSELESAGGELVSEPG